MLPRVPLATSRHTRCSALTRASQNAVATMTNVVAVQDIVVWQLQWSGATTFTTLCSVFSSVSGALQRT
jgi:hypothetical protein